MYFPAGICPCWSNQDSLLLIQSFTQITKPFLSWGLKVFAPTTVKNAFPAQDGSARLLYCTVTTSVVQKQFLNENHLTKVTVCTQMHHQNRFSSVPVKLFTSDLTYLPALF